jgi:hypothetical protein
MIKARPSGLASQIQFSSFAFCDPGRLDLPGSFCVQALAFREQNRSITQTRT